MMACLPTFLLATLATDSRDSLGPPGSLDPSVALERQDKPSNHDEFPPADPPEHGYLTISAGPYIGIESEKVDLVEIGAEWRFPPYWNLTPLVGTTWFEGGDMYVYGGLRWEIDLGRGFYIAPGFALGNYHSDELDLGLPLEFRSSIELGLQVADNVRLGITSSHISNADIADDNPGRNSVSLTLAFRPFAPFD